MHVFGVENRDTLTHKAIGYSAKLLKKPDQCRAVYACSHLFWANDQDGVRDGERVLLCLKRALKISNATQYRQRRQAAAQAAYEKAKEEEKSFSSNRAGGMTGGFGGFPRGMPGGFPGGMPGGMPGAAGGGMPGAGGGMPGECLEISTSAKY